MTFSETLQRQTEKVRNRQSMVDLHLSAAVLMFAVITADGETDQLELANMIEILRTHYALSCEEIASLIAAVRVADVDDHGLELLSQKLCQHWSPCERKQLLDDLWTLAIADNHIKSSERKAIRLIARNLQLTASDITRAQLQAEQRLE